MRDPAGKMTMSHAIINLWRIVFMNMKKTMAALLALCLLMSARSARWRSRRTSWATC